MGDDGDGTASLTEWGIAFGDELNEDCVLLTYDSRVAAESDLVLSGAKFLVQRPVKVGRWQVVKREQEQVDRR